MSDRHRRYSKRELLGNLYVDCVMSVTDLGLAARFNRWDLLRAFLAVGEARAERLVEEEDGFLILQSVPGQANTGGIYLFAEPLQSFFWLRFDQNESRLTTIARRGLLLLAETLAQVRKTGIRCRPQLDVVYQQQALGARPAHSQRSPSYFETARAALSITSVTSPGCET